MRSKLLKSLFLVCFLALMGITQESAAQNASVFPGESLEGSSSNYWREVKDGRQGNISLPDKRKAYLIRNSGEEWRTIRNNMVFTFGAIGFAGMVGALVVFYLVRGKIRLEGELSGKKIQRFKAMERYNHWTMAGSFILLGLTGLTLLYGRALLVPLLGHETFSTIAGAGKFIHNNVSWLFMISLCFTTVFWAKDNLWDRYDLNWILKGGGLLGGDSHPPSAKFNFGEKTMFWLVVLGGGFVSLTGLALLFPFVIADISIMQLLQLGHAIMALIMSIAILGHIYIGTIGMEGAIDGMKTGYVDETWAKEHHAAWAEEHGIKVEHHAKDETHIRQESIAE